MRLLSPEVLKTAVQESGRCINCGACTALCPYFRSYNGKIAMIFPCSLTEGKCAAHCPKAEVDMDDLSLFFHGNHWEGTPLGPYRSIYKASSSESAPRGIFQNGGTVSALVSFALDSGYLDSAVLTGRKGLMPEPVIVQSAEEAVRCATSKYLAAPTLGMLNQAIGEGRRHIGVVGTPCQMTAVQLIRMHHIRQEHQDDPIGLSIGLFCTWTLEPRRFLAYLSCLTRVDDIHRMNILPPPSKTAIIENKEGTLELPLEEIRSFIPYGCTICPDMTAEFSDLSVGAFEDAPEWNTLIVRTEKGEEIVSRAVKKGYLTLEDMPEKSLAHLCDGAERKKRRALEKAVSDNVVNTDGPDKVAALRVPEDTLKPPKLEER